MVHLQAKSQRVFAVDSEPGVCEANITGEFPDGANFKIKKPFKFVVHLQGFEPGTHWLRVSCSTNWAKGAYNLNGLAPPAGLEPATSWLTVMRSTDWAKEEYFPFFWKGYVGIDLSYRSVSRQVFSAQQSLTSVFGMGTGGPSALEALTILFSMKL